MKIKDSAIVASIHFACTFVIGLMIFAFSPETMPLDFTLAVATGVGVGRFVIELVKANQLFDKMVAHFKS